MTDVFIAGSNNVTGHNVVNALAGRHTILGYDYSEVSVNPTNRICQNVKVPAATDPTYSEAIRKLLDEHRPKLIIPSNDSDLRALLSMNDELVERGVVLNGVGPHTADFLDKRVTSDLFSANGILTPEVIDNVFDDEPSMSRVVRKRLVGNGKKFSRIVHSGSPDITYSEWKDGIVTRFIEGDEYTIDVLCDLESNLISAVPRLRREVRYGMVHFGEVVKDYVVLEASRDLIRRLKLTGMNCVQCIKSGPDVHFFEVNARPGSGLSLTVAAGVNMPDLMARLTFGEKIAVQQPQWGLKMVRYFEGYYFT